MKERMHPADRAATEWLDKQTNDNDGGRWADRAVLALLAVILMTFGTLIFVLPTPRLSEKENRVLADLPFLSLSSILDGSFTAGLSDFYSDRVPFRDLLIEMKALTELTALRIETGGVIAGRDGYLVDRLEYGDGGYGNLTDNLAAIDNFAAVSGLEAQVAIIPNAVSVLSHLMPSVYSSQRADAVYGYLPDSAAELRDELRARAESGEYVWYRTDHHYTTLGAYYVYCYLGGVLGYTPYPIEFFDQRVVSDCFLGTSYSAAGLPPSVPDTVTLFRYPTDGNYTVSYGDIRQTGFYDMSRLSAKDKYSVFLGGNHALTSVSLDGEERETLVVIKDSFAHAVAPFLALHFDLLLVDLRYYSSSVSRLCRESGASRALVLCGVDTLASAADMKKLEIGLYS